MRLATNNETIQRPLKRDVVPASYAVPVDDSLGTSTLYDGGPASGDCGCSQYNAGYVCCPPLFSHNRLSVRAEYLHWWSDGYEVPPLVTTSFPTMPPASAGVLGEPGTTVLFGGGGLTTGAQSGGRITLDYWLSDSQLTGLEATYMAIGKGTDGFSASRSELPVLARPYFDAVSGAEAAMLVAHPDLLTGTTTAAASTEFQGVEVMLRRNLLSQCGRDIDFLLGWRFVDLDESLRAEHASEWTGAQGPIVVGTTKEVSDFFDTTNQFHGVNLGIVFTQRNGPWAVDLLTKLGLGITHSSVLIDGRTVTTVPGFGASTFTGGLLAQETNIGSYDSDAFAVVPELGATLRYDVSCRLCLTLGYTFIYWSKVARPGEQVDRSVSQLPPEPPGAPRQPEFALHPSDYWVQGMSFGLQYRF